MKERVIASKEDRLMLSEHFGARKDIISKALNFGANSMSAREVRCYAVNVLGCRVCLRPARLIQLNNN